MKLTKDETIVLINLLINDLANDEWVISEAYKQREQLGSNDGFVREVATTALALSVKKAIFLKAMIAKGTVPIPNEEGQRLIGFWLEVEKTITEGCCDDN